MLNKKEQIFRLFAAMSPSEKAYFRKFSYKLKPDDSIAFELFDLMEKLSKKGEINDRELKMVFEKKFAGKEYVKTKSKLLQMLFESTVNYDSHQSDLHQIFYLIELSESLFNRKLLNDAIQILKKAENLADDTEEIELKLKIKERIINIESYIKVFRKEELGNSQYSDKNEIINSISNKIMVRDATMQVHHFQKIIGTPRSDEDHNILKKIEDLPGMKVDFHSLDLSSKIDQTLSRCVLYFSKGKFEDVTRVCQRFLDHYQHKKKRPAIFIFKLIALYDAYMQACIMANESKKFDKAFAQLENLDLKSEEHVKLKTGVVLMMKAISGTKDFKNVNYLNLNEDFRKIEHEVLIPNYRKVSIAYYIILGLFIHDHYHQAQSRIAWLFQQADFNIRYDIEIAVRMINLIILMEQNDWFHLEYAIRNFQQMLENRERSFDLENVFIKMLKRALRAKEPGEFLKILIDTSAKIKLIINKKPSEAAFLSAFDLEGWIQSKVSGKKYKEVLKMNAT